ncbi:hypothetical protein BB558_006821 [Smittium angustum]|uniref:Uncharacterized protein n=1 Tax=Smittium angustum TaxID=133377 RepID=A0A2U1IWM8_SMIAN|nr:hypothetical protein BB558_006821 [Smittium angustum]
MSVQEESCLIGKYCSPTKNDSWETGKQYQIVWNPTYPSFNVVGQVDVYIYNSFNTRTPIVKFSGINNGDGTFVVTPETNWFKTITNSNNKKQNIDSSTHKTKISISFQVVPNGSISTGPDSESFTLYNSSIPRKQKTDQQNETTLKVGDPILVESQDQITSQTDIKVILVSLNTTETNSNTLTRSFLGPGIPQKDKELSSTTKALIGTGIKSRKSKKENGFYEYEKEGTYYTNILRNNQPNFLDGSDKDSQKRFKLNFFYKLTSFTNRNPKPKYNPFNDSAFSSASVLTFSQYNREKANSSLNNQSSSHKQSSSYNDSSFSKTTFFTDSFDTSNSIRENTNDIGKIRLRKNSTGVLPMHPLPIKLVDTNNSTNSKSRLSSTDAELISQSFRDAMNIAPSSDFHDHDDDNKFGEFLDKLSKKIDAESEKKTEKWRELVAQDRMNQVLEKEKSILQSMELKSITHSSGNIL